MREIAALFAMQRRKTHHDKRNSQCRAGTCHKPRVGTIDCLRICSFVLSAAYAVGKALEGMARQPEVAGNLRTNMILGCAITETTGIYSLVIALLILFM